MASLSGKDINDVQELYYQKYYSMQRIADTYGISLNQVVYFMRRNRLKRRSAAQTNAIIYKNKKASFQVKENLTNHELLLQLAGVILYWAEGYKSSKSAGIDFANSDPDMIRVFTNFLRMCYTLDESKFRVLLYCYADQNINELQSFWSNLTGIPTNQFSKPYIRNNFKEDSRKMTHGMIHVRYYDKKLLQDVKAKIYQHIAVLQS